MKHPSEVSHRSREQMPLHLPDHLAHASGRVSRAWKSALVVIAFIACLVLTCGNAFAQTTCPTGADMCSCAARKTVTSGPWSNPSTWEGGILPAAGQLVCVKAGHTVTLDMDPPAMNGLVIHGVLIFPNSANRALTSQYILVHGDGAEFRIGTESAPYTANAVITLTGTDETANVIGSGILSSGTKFLMAMEGGIIRMHGSSRNKLPWTQLEATAQAGATTITLQEHPANWAVGDKICIAPTSFSPEEAESAHITAINGNVLTLDRALTYKHFGDLQEYDGVPVDERAEVGMLTRNILVQGAPDSDAGQFGGHGMIMPGGQGYVEGVMFRRMGQAGFKGRYPWHWHVVARFENRGITGHGQYIRNCSIDGGYQRAIAVHGTHGIRVEQNVAYDIFNHAFVISEDGDERDNYVYRNLGIFIKRPPAANFAFPRYVNGSLMGSLQNEDEPSVFWMRNANQTFLGNRAAGAQRGNGFFFDIEFRGIQESNIIDTVAVFNGNVAHSFSSFGDDLFNPHQYNHVSGFGFVTNDITGAETYLGPGYLRMRNNVGFKGKSGGIWIDSQEFVERNILVNNAGAFHSKSAVIKDNLVLGYTANSGDDVSGNRTRVPIGIAFPSVSPYLKAYNNTWVDITDGVFKDRDGPDFNFAAMAWNNQFVGSTVPISFTSHTDGNFLDVDGSIAGAPSLIGYASLNSSSVYNAAWNAYATPLATVTTEPRLWITAPAEDGMAVYGPDVTIQYQAVNFPATQTLKVEVLNRPDIPTFTFSPSAATSFTIPGLSPGNYIVSLTATKDPIKFRKIARVYFDVVAPGAPLAIEDKYTTPRSTALTIAGAGVLGNDTGATGSNVALDIGPANGTVVLNSNGSFTYTPFTGFVGYDGFTYRASQGGLESNEAQVIIKVGGTQDTEVPSEILPEADSFARKGYTTNFGSLNELLVQDDASNSQDRISYLRFDLGAMSGNANQVDLVLTLKALDSGSNHTVQLAEVASDSWAESTLKWTTKPALGNTLATYSLIPADVGGEISVDVTAYVNAQRSADGKVSFALVQPENANSLVKFHSRESDLPPKLEVTE